MNFDKAFELVFGHEGAFTDDPKDRGNWTSGTIGTGKLNGTKFGISAAAYPNLDIRNLTVDQAKAIYKKDYWDKNNLDAYPEPIRFELFDMAVNMGWKNGVKILQRAVGTTDDGIIGPKTIAATNAMDADKLYVKLAARRLQYYTSLSTFSTYGKGWVNRVANNMLEY